MKILRFVTKKPDATAEDLIGPLQAMFGNEALTLTDITKILDELRNTGATTVTLHLTHQRTPTLLQRLDPEHRLPGLGITLIIRRETSTTTTDQTDQDGNPVLEVIPTGWQADLSVHPEPAVALIEDLAHQYGTPVELPKRSSGTFTAIKLPGGDAYLLPSEPDSPDIVWPQATTPTPIPDTESVEPAQE